MSFDVRACTNPKRDRLADEKKDNATGQSTANKKTAKKKKYVKKVSAKAKPVIHHFIIFIIICLLR